MKKQKAKSGLQSELRVATSTSIIEIKKPLLVPLDITAEL